MQNSITDRLVIQTDTRIKFLKLITAAFFNQILDNIKYMYIIFFFFFSTSVAPRHDELFVSTGSGLLQRVNWLGLLEGEMTMSIHSIPFTNDLENARGI